MGSKWTAREISQLRLMRGQGLSRKIAAERLGRSEDSVKLKLQWIDANKETVTEYAQRRNAARRLKRTLDQAETPATRKIRVASGKQMHIPDTVIAEWRWRGSLSHASTTAEFCGDPLPGYSALDRR